jgi:hypothetical protein
MLRGLRFQKRLRVLPGVRINLSKSGASASIGPRGADVNIGPHGVTTNAGIPGTGLSYRSKVGKTGSAWIGIATLVVGLGFAAYKNVDKIGALFAPSPAAVTQGASQAHPAAAEAAPQDGQRARQAAEPKPTSIRAQAAKLLVAGGTIYVRRGGSVLREDAKPSAATLKKLDKGTAVTVLALDDDWTQVKTGGVTGWMRTSVLGPKP